VAEDTVEGFRISTVWIGIDMRFGGLPPLIFETMIFDDGLGKDAFGGDVYMDRYATEAQALEGHQRALAWLGERLAAVKDVVVPETAE
jgi:hypothetical protein